MAKSDWLAKLIRYSRSIAAEKIDGASMGLGLAR